MFVERKESQSYARLSGSFLLFLHLSLPLPLHLFLILPLLVGKEKFFLYPSRSSSWMKNYISISSQEKKPEVSLCVHRAQ